MPTYTVTTANLSLSHDQKAAIAEAITNAHSDQTGAPGYFAQVRFVALAEGDQFIGGRINQGPHLFVSGLIRAGRTVAAKQALMNQVLDQIQSITGIGREDIWCYLQDIDAQQMVEFGRVLPSPGEEAAWEAGLSDQKRRELFGP